MLEESISSSPCKSKKSIRKLRCTRRIKRKGLAIANPDIQVMANRFLQHLYDVSDEDSPEQGVSRNSTVLQDSLLTDFKPFQKERRLCFANRTSTSVVGSKNLPFSETSGFLPCPTTVENQMNIKKPIVNNSCLEITDSELLNCCNQVDEMLISTPNKRLRLVNSILEDFALSPYTEKSRENLRFWEYSPEFVLKTKPRVTYSSRRRDAHRFVCNKRLDFSLINDCESSSISEQEDQLQLGEISGTTFVSEATERLCENLLNLSAYYTQTRAALDKHTPDVVASMEIKEDGEATELWPTFSICARLQELALLRSTWTHSLRKCSSYSSSEDFFGFPEENSDQILEKEMSDNTSYDILKSPICSQKLDEHREIIMDVEDHDTNGTEGIQPNKGDKFDGWDDDFMEIFAFIKTPPHSCKKESLDAVEETNGNVCFGFKTASSKQIHISKEARSKAAEMLKSLPEINVRQTVKDDILIETSMQVMEDIGINDSEVINRTFKCSAINNLHDQPSTSKAALQANKEYEIRRNFDWDGVSMTNTEATFLNSSNNNIGFQTANGKNIKPTSKALKGIENLLKEFQSDFEKFDENDLESMKNKINLKQSKQSDTKAINVNKKPNYWEEEADLANVIFSEWPLEEELKAPNSQTNVLAGTEVKTFEMEFGRKQAPLINTFNTKIVGFSTAAGKKVSISEKGKKVAESLLQKIKNDCDTNDLLEIKNSIHKKKNKTAVSHKPISLRNDVDVGFKEVPTCKDTAVSCDKAQYKHLHASKTCESNIKNSFTELSAKSPLSVSVANSIIARKNLLSLSRRRKGSSIISPARGTNGNALAERINDDHADTPNKNLSSINNTTNVQTPKDPNGSVLLFNASKCSTPRLELRVPSPRNVDDDFKPISWDHNKSITGICSNTTIKSPNPSVNDRIARLRMYGEAPPISPILTNFQSHCRSSGLRRTRSMLKKAENK